MARRRLGVALVLDPPLADEVDGLRRAAGDPALDRIAAHVTLVAPVNVAEDSLGDVLGVLRAAAAACPGPIVVSLGPPATFWPDNPVLYLQLGGDLDGIRTLRQRVFVPPLQRQQTWPWVPHVTVAEGMDPQRLQACLHAMADYRASVTFDRVVLLEHVDAGDRRRSGTDARGRPARRWQPLADVDLAPPAIVGRGGAEVTIHAGRIVDPEAQAELRHHAPSNAPSGFDAGPGAVTLTARTTSGFAGVAVAWSDGDGRHVAVFVTPAGRGTGVGRHLLSALESRLLALHGRDTPVLHAHGPAGFYRACSGWAVPTD